MVACMMHAEPPFHPLCTQYQATYYTLDKLRVPSAMPRTRTHAAPTELFPSAQPCVLRGPQQVPHARPAHARSWYKLVFVEPDARPCAISIHDQQTRYPCSTTLIQTGLSEQEGAMWVLRSLLDAVLKEDSAALAAHDMRHLSLAVARCFAW